MDEARSPVLKMSAEIPRFPPSALTASEPVSEDVGCARRTAAAIMMRNEPLEPWSAQLA
jgi:hypothetical protein